MPSLDSDLLIGLIGALVGGVASLAGSVVVNRLQLRKSMRIRMLQDIVPRLLNEWGDPRNRVMLPGEESPDIADPKLVLQRLVELRRVAIIAAPKDARLVNKLLATADIMGDLYGSLKPLPLPTEEDEQKRNRQMLSKVDLEFVLQLDAFLTYLESKMHWLPVEKGSVPARLLQQVRLLRRKPETRNQRQ